MTPGDETWTNATLTAVAGCSTGTLRTWRHRNGLFPHTMGAHGWNRFTFIDVCIARTVVLMTSAGITASEAVWFSENYLRTPFAFAQRRLLEGEFSGIVAFAPKGVADTASFRLYVKPAELGEALAQFGGLVTLLDLNLIHEHVRAGLTASAEAQKAGA